MAIIVSTISAFIATAGQTCTIQKPLQSVDDIGQTIRNFVDHKVNITCWAQEKSTENLTQDGKVFIRNSVDFYFNNDPEVFEGFIITFKNKSYIIDGVENQGGLDQLFKIEAELKK